MTPEIWFLPRLVRGFFYARKVVRPVFVRVRDKTTGHEYDAPVVTVKRWPDRFVVVDKRPVAVQRRPKFAVVRPRKKDSSREAGRTAPVGDDRKEG